MLEKSVLLHSENLGWQNQPFALHGTLGEDGRIQAVLDYLKIFYAKYILRACPKGKVDCFFSNTLTFFGNPRKV